MNTHVETDTNGNHEILYRVGFLAQSNGGERARLARLGVALANALQAKNSTGADLARTRAFAAYKNFLTLCKDADPDIPIYKQAKAEYANLK